MVAVAAVAAVLARLVQQVGLQHITAVMAA
jgi:hypothetical protein